MHKNIQIKKLIIQNVKYDEADLEKKESSWVLSGPRKEKNLFQIKSNQNVLLEAVTAHNFFIIIVFFSLI